MRFLATALTKAVRRRWPNGHRFCVGFETPGQQRHYAHDFAVRHRGDVLEVEISASLLEAVAPDAVVDQLPSLRRAQASEETPGRLRLNFPRLFVVFHPFAGGGSNPGPGEWLAENWLELGRLVLGEGLLVVVSDGSADAEPATRLRDRMLRGQRRDVPVAGVARLSDYWVLGRPASVVSVQTEMMHLEVAAGARLIEPDGPIDPERWGPVRAGATAIGPMGPVCGFLNLGFQYEDRPTDCMARISVASVWEVLRELLNAPPVKA